MLKTLGLVAAGYAGVCGVARLAYRSVLYPAPSQGLSADPRGGVLTTMTASDGEPVQVARYDPGTAARATIVFFHGNGTTIAGSPELGRRAAARGIRLLAMEYRGYGDSPCRQGPSEEGIYADAAGVLAGLRDEGIADHTLTLLGSSLGSGVAVEMASRGHGARLVLRAPYMSIPHIAQSVMPVLPMTLLIGDRFDNIDKAPALEQPTLIIHGDQDRVVPYSHGVALSQAIRGARLLTIEGAGHNDLILHAGTGYFDAIFEWATS